MTPSATAFALLLAAGGTQLKADGNLLFEADQQVTFGASFTDTAIKATIVCPAPTAIRLRTARPPRRVFVALELLADTAWTYDGREGWFATTLPAGTHKLQLRFDDTVSLKPVTARLPVVQCGPNGAQPVKRIGVIEVLCADERLVGTFEWPGQPGIYSVRAMRKGNPVSAAQLRIRSRANRSGQDGEFFLDRGTLIDLEGSATGMTPPADRIETQLLRRLAATRRVARADLPWETAVVVEGEGFEAEGGGTVSRSTEHGNTHGGACIFAWGDAGHWIDWIVPIPATGSYRLVIVAASDYPQALRAVGLDGTPLPAAPLVAFDGTGGWGRNDPDEWQAQEILDVEGQPLIVRLTQGDHVLRMENVAGDHMNVDCILLFPAQ